MKQFTDKDEDVPVEYKNKFELQLKLVRSMHELQT